MRTFSLSEHPSEAELLAKYFRGIGEPTRLRILELLRDGELAVHEISGRLGITQPCASNHLATLRWCGFVTARRDFRTVHYALADERVAELLALGRALAAEDPGRFADAPRPRGAGPRRR